MKKIRFIAPLIFISILTFGSCKKADQQSSGKASVFSASKAYSEEKPEYLERTSLLLNTDTANLVDFESVKKFFTLDFTPEYPDSLFNEAAKKVSLKKVSKKSEKNDKNDSYIPGIRKLSDYITKYVTKKATIPEYSPAEETEEDDTTKEFFIEDWGPQGKIVAGENHPSFYVIFSRPVNSLQALDQPQTTSDIMTIEPALPGVFRWYGSRHLSFEADVPADPTIQYTIKVKSDLKSAGGKKLTGQTLFRTQAEAVEITNLWGGYIKESECAYNWSTGALPPYENRFVMRTNYTTSLLAIQQNLKVYVDKLEAVYDVQPVYEDIFNWWYNQADYDQAAGRTNTWLVEIKSSVPHAATVEVKNTEGNSESYFTLLPFTVEEVGSMTGYSSAKAAWPLNIYFSQTPDKASLIENITYDKGQKITEENIITSGRSVKICNLPFD